MIDNTHGYFKHAYTNVNDLVSHARRALYHVNYDTMVGTGLSGSLVVPILARRLRKHWMIVRKPDDKSTHSSMLGEGKLGERWLFVDDFVASGETRVRTLQTIEEIVKRARRKAITLDGCAALNMNTRFVGTYQYEYSLYMEACSESHKPVIDAVTAEREAKYEEFGAIRISPKDFSVENFILARGLRGQPLHTTG